MLTYTHRQELMKSVGSNGSLLLLAIHDEGDMATHMRL
jgi:hypothetical protein